MKDKKHFAILQSCPSSEKERSAIPSSGEMNKKFESFLERPKTSFVWWLQTTCDWILPSVLKKYVHGKIIIILNGMEVFNRDNHECL